MNSLNNPLMEKGNRPNFTQNKFILSKTTWKKLKKASDIFFKISEKTFEFYKKEDPEIVELIEFGLPESLIYSLRKTKTPPQKSLLRFDFFISKNGPKLIEVARNPWGLFLFENYLKETKEDLIFNTEDIYKNIFQDKHKKIAIWEESNIYDDTDLMINYFSKKNISFTKVQSYKELQKNKPDGLFADLDVIYFTGKLEEIKEYAEKLTPPLSNIILKHKSFLVLLSKIIKNELKISKEIPEKEKKFISDFVVNAQILNTKEQETLFEDGAIKNVIGMWSRQVQILSPKQKKEHGKSAHKKRQLFRNSLKNGIKNKNAIWQEYIDSVEKNNLIAEISLVCSKKKHYPFVRLYPTQKDVTGGIGITKII